jgi:polyhydroxybutyrate depolymerase
MRRFLSARRQYLQGIALLATIMLYPHSMARAEMSPNPERSLDVEGVSRTYRVHSPSGQKAGVALPLLFAFHGAGGTSDSISRLTRLDEVADRAGFFVVYPQGIENRWNDGRETGTALAKVNDVGFVRALLARLETDYTVDRRRVYATGFSNGAFFTQRLACEMASQIAAVAAVSGQLSQYLSTACKPARPISVLLVHGTADPVVPFDGGRTRGSRGGPLLSVAASVAFWEKTDACPPGGATVKLPDATPDDGTHVRREPHEGCAEGTEVTLLTVDGGGHTWPGGPQYLSTWIIGKVSHAVDASAALWEFLAHHSLPPSKL